MSRVINSRNNQVLVTNLETAKTFSQRLIGLMGRKALPTGNGLLLHGSGNSIHTCFMRFAIDVAFVTKTGEIKHTRSDLKPWRVVVAPVLSFTDCLELPAGTLKKATPELEILYVLKIKIIKGPEAGKVFEMPGGDYVVGRSPDCDIILNSPGISKNHARFSVQGTKCIITDLDSSNGTFVNGTKIHDRILRAGDRIGFHDVIVELSVAYQEQQSLQRGPTGPPSIGWNENIAYQAPVQMPPTGVVGPAGPQLQGAPTQQASAQPSTMTSLIESYIEQVILPGVYKLAEIYPMSHVLAGFVAIFILMVTALSSVPMAALTKEGVQKEAQRRALTIARQLAAGSEKLLATGAEANIRTDLAEGEDGVISAMVVSQDDGHVIAPLSKADTYSNEQFVADARKHENDPYYIASTGPTTIGVSVPIHGFSSEMGQQLVVAESVVLYKMDSQDWSSTMGLFARILIIALVLGGLLYFLLYRLVTHPIIEATEQLDSALRGERDTIDTKIDLDVFKKLIENINSAISRMSKSGNTMGPKVSIDRSTEASNLVRIINDPAFALDREGVFLQVNSAFEELIGMRFLTLQGQSLDVLQDQGMKLNLEDLLQKAKGQPGSIVSHQLEITGRYYDIDMQASPHPDQMDKYEYVIATLKKRQES